MFYTVGGQCVPPLSSVKVNTRLMHGLYKPVHGLEMVEFVVAENSSGTTKHLPCG